MFMKSQTYSTPEFAEELGVATKTVMRWEAQGLIPRADRLRKENGPRIWTASHLKAAKQYRDRIIPGNRQRSLNLQQV